MNSGCFPFVSRKAPATGFWQIQNPRLAPCGSQPQFSDTLLAFFFFFFFFFPGHPAR